MALVLTPIRSASSPIRIPASYLDLPLGWKVYGAFVETTDVGIAKRRVEIFSAGCKTCQRTIEQLREQIDSRHEIIVHDMNSDERAAEKAGAFGIRTVPAIVVDGFLLACCKNKGPTLR